MSKSLTELGRGLVDDQEDIKKIKAENPIKRDSERRISDWVERQSHYNPAMVRLEPQEDFDPCIKGTVERINLYVLCYDELEIVLMLENKHGMTREEAEEHLEYNVKGASMGEDSPVFLNQIV